MARKQPSSEPEFRLRPRRPPVPRDERKAWSRSFKNLIHLVRMTSKPAYPSRSGTAPRKPHLQRCAVRVTYSPNRVSGQWAAHGRYIARGSATKQASIEEAGFTATNNLIDVPQMLCHWQDAGDQRLFKLIRKRTANPGSVTGSRPASRRELGDVGHLATIHARQDS